MRFKVGTIVIMQPPAYPDLLGRARSRYAVVVGQRRSALGVRVIRDGLRSPENWAASFWARSHEKRTILRRQHPGLVRVP